MRSIALLLPVLLTLASSLGSCGPAFRAAATPATPAAAAGGTIPIASR